MPILSNFFPPKPIPRSAEPHASVLGLLLPSQKPQADAWGWARFSRSWKITASRDQASRPPEVETTRNDTFLSTTLSQVGRYGIQIDIACDIRYRLRLSIGSAGARAENQRPFPDQKRDELSPPVVSQVSGCAKAMHVCGYLPHAMVRVFAHVTEQIGVANPYFAESDIPLTRELKVGEKIPRHRRR